MLLTMPAEWTRTEGGSPKRPRMASASSATDAADVTSTGCARCSPSDPPASLCVLGIGERALQLGRERSGASAASWETSAETSLAPSSAKRLQTAAPIEPPLPAAHFSLY